jgi:hypothetical protein
LAANDDATRSALLAAVRTLEPMVRTTADQIEQDRQLPQPLVDAMAAAGLFKIAVPAVLGGGEADLETQVRVVEEVSRADGSVGWCLMVAAQLGMLGGYLPEATAEVVFGHDPGAYVAGVVAPAGRAVSVGGGYRATGRWRYASGCRHATWLLGACVLHDGDAPRLRSDGSPELRWLLFPAPECRIIDTGASAACAGRAATTSRSRMCSSHASAHFRLPSSGCRASRWSASTPARSTRSASARFRPPSPPSLSGSRAARSTPSWR